MTQPAPTSPTTADVSPFRKYGMLAWTVAGAVIAAYWSALTDNRITLDEWLVIAVVGVQGVAIYIVPQTPNWRWAKNTAAGFIGVLGLGGQVWTMVVESPTQQNVTLIVITFLTTAGALVLPAVSDNGVGSGLGADARNPVG
jgi:hypothetical protein